MHFFPMRPHHWFIFITLIGLLASIGYFACLNGIGERVDHYNSFDDPAYTSKPKEEKYNFNGVHVINTRFMQHQPNLRVLGLARIALFETLCLPSIVSQTNQHFLWVIRADPNLNPELRQKMINLLAPHQNFIFIGSNYNPAPGGFGRSKRKLNQQARFEKYLLDQKVPEENNNTLSVGGNNTAIAAQASLWSGNISLLREAFDKSAADDEILLETRLDADDGLHRDFVQTVQEESVKYLIPQNTSSISKKELERFWRIWCIDANIQWHPISHKEVTSQEGFLVEEYDNICVTPGLTHGFGAASHRSTIPKYNGHGQLVKIIEQCKGSSLEQSCVARLKSLYPGAIRARTATSAGMVGVLTRDESGDNKQDNEQEELWKSIHNGFSISILEVRKTRDLMIDRASEIAAENLSGQCTEGLSCKDEARKKLEKLIQNGLKV
mmetsp:Transcript_2214/g.4717  ORF Transcript_2214/g.4717 Transcript_2214/m.4717 type:complete len:439 (-) Transcript_2214:117-1433(-)